MDGEGRDTLEDELYDESFWAATVDEDFAVERRRLSSELLRHSGCYSSVFFPMLHVTCYDMVVRGSCFISTLSNHYLLTHWASLLYLGVAIQAGPAHLGPGPFRFGPYKARTMWAGPFYPAYFLQAENTGPSCILFGPRVREPARFF